MPGGTGKSEVLWFANRGVTPVNPSLEARSFLEEIQTGGKVEAGDWMPEEYRRIVIDLAWRFADSELSAAYAFLPWILKAPTLPVKARVARMIEEEIEHARVFYRCLKELGVDVRTRMRDWDAAYRQLENGKSFGLLRAGLAGEFAFLYYPIRDWTDFLMANFCVEGASRHLLEDGDRCSYGPLGRAMRRVLKDEIGHAGHGDAGVRRMARTREGGSRLQKALDQWFPRAFDLFGSPDSPRHKTFQKWRLKTRDNAELIESFYGEMRKKTRSLGLVVPEC